MNSSFAPLGPRVRNSLITTGAVDDGEGEGDGVGDGLGGVGVSEGRGEGDGDGVAEGVDFGVGVGVGVGAITETVEAFDCTPRATANTSVRPAPTAFA